MPVQLFPSLECLLLVRCLGRPLMLLFICEEWTVIILASSLLLKEFPPFVFVTLFFFPLCVFHLMLIPPPVTPSPLFSPDGSVSFDGD